MMQLTDSTVKVFAKS